MTHYPPMRFINTIILVACFMLLEWISNVGALHDLNITPWNPAPALALAALMRHGKAALGPLFLAIVMADLVVRSGQPLMLDVFLSLGLVAGYWAFSALLTHRLGNSELFHTSRQLAEWCGIVVAGTLAISGWYALLCRFADVISAAEVFAAIQRYWVGDAAGVLVSMPLIWQLFDPRSRNQLTGFVRSFDFLIVIMLVAVTLLIAFGLGTQSDYSYFYFLFAPVTFAAARRRLEGAIVAANIVQIGVIITVLYLGWPASSVIEIQWRVIVWAVLGLFIGVVVSERERVSKELRQTLRIAAAGEMAAALAHELNQPLAAITAYGSACQKMIARGDPPDAVVGVIRSLVSESFRAGEIVRRLRDFFRSGAKNMEQLDLGHLVGETCQQFVDRSIADNVQFEVLHEDNAYVLGDKLQLEVVIRNLVENAFDAVMSDARQTRKIQVLVAPYGTTQIGVTVTDSGRGVPAAMADRIFEPFQTTKTNGMGLGLAVSRSIVQAHDGAIWFDVAARGVFRFTLPAVSSREGLPL